MAPGNNERHTGHTGTIPKTKARNNCNVPQEAVTPTRRDMSSNMVSTSLDWVPVSEYNPRSNHNQSRKPTNNTSDHELTDLDNSGVFESGFGRFVPVRPQPRVLPLNVQNRESINSEHHDDGSSSTVSGHTLHPYAHQMQNGLNPHSNHAAAAVMIVNPTTPNAVVGNITQPYNANPNQNRNNLSRNINTSRNNFDGNISNNNTPPISNSRGSTKTVNIMNNMFDQSQAGLNNANENNQIHRESARALGEAIVAACPDAAAVERRLGQIREYIRVTSSLVDTMRNSEDEAYIEHTKEEYDELVQMVMKLKESEKKLEEIVEKAPDNIEVPEEEEEELDSLNKAVKSQLSEIENTDTNLSIEKSCNIKSMMDANSNLKKVTNIENEQLNKNVQIVKAAEETENETEKSEASELPPLEKINETNDETGSIIEIEEIETIPFISPQDEPKTDENDPHLDEALKKNIMSCVEKAAIIEELKITSKESSDKEDIVVRPVSVQSNGSAYSENELWQNEIKNKMEVSQMRLATLKQQQKRLLKYQEEAKNQLDDMNRQAQEIHPSTSHDNFAGIQNQPFNSGSHHQNRLYAANQIGVATTLPHTAEALHSHQNSAHNLDNEREHSAHSSHSQDERYHLQRDANIAINDETAGGRDSDAEEDEGLLSDRARMLQVKLRELQMRKQHMENLVTEFQKLQVATQAGVVLERTHNTYSTSGEESADEEQARNCNRASNNIKNEDPFKLMEIKAIKAALQKTKDLMRSVENYETEHLPTTHEEAFPVPHSNIHDNKSSGGGSGWSTDGSVCRVRNSLRRKQPNRDHDHHDHDRDQHTQHLQHNQHVQHQIQQHNQQLQQHMQPHTSHHNRSSHETNLTALQDLAQELRMETEKIMGERARIKDLVASKEVVRKQKKVNEEVRIPQPGPAERRQIELRAILAEKQRELEALINKEKTMSSTEAQNQKSNSRAASAVQSVNQSYVSEQEEPNSRSEQILMDSQNLRDADNYRGGGDNYVGRQANPGPSHISSAYASDSDNASRNKSNQRSRARRRQAQDRPLEENVPQANINQNIRQEPRMVEAPNVNMVHPTQPSVTDSPLPYQHLPPPPVWSNNNKINQDMRTNQFTQNSHSQTMERLLSTPQMSFPPSMPFNMMMPYGVVGGCGCACGAWGAWCWQQLALTQRDLHALTQQIHHLEERWRAETASHTLNNQVPPGNRANNYWDNFRSYSRQNLLSANSKTNENHFAVAPAHNPHPLVERSHNTLHHTSSSTSPSLTPKRNTNISTTQNSQSLPPNNEEAPGRPRRNVAYERSLSFSSAPDVLNVNQNPEDAPAAHNHQRYEDTSLTNTNGAHNVNVNRQDSHSNPFRNLNITNPIPEIIQSHANNLNTTTNKKKSSSKLPAKNSSNRRNYSLDYSQTSNINIASTSEMPNPNLASTSRGQNDKATSKLFDLLRENVYSEVTTLIDVNESHPDFLIQLFRELQGISSDTLRQKVLQSIRNVSSQCSSGVESQNDENLGEETRPEPVTTSSENTNCHECDSLSNQIPCTSTQIDNKVVRFLLMKSEEIFSNELLDALASHILTSIEAYCESAQLCLTKTQVVEKLSKYKGLRVCDVSGDIIETIPIILSNTVSEDTIHLGSDSSVLQDVAGALNLFSSSDSQLHQMNGCPYEMWPAHVHMEVDGTNDNSARSSQESKMDLINCSEMHNGDLAEADQTCPSDISDSAVNTHEEVAPNAEALPDVVETEEVTPTEAEAEWLGLDRVPTRLHMEQSSEK